MFQHCTKGGKVLPSRTELNVKISGNDVINTHGEFYKHSVWVYCLWKRSISNTGGEQEVPACLYYLQIEHPIQSLTPKSHLLHMLPTCDSYYISLMECQTCLIHIIKSCISVTHFWEGSWAKYFFAFSYVIGLPSSIKSDKSMSNVGPRLLNSDPNDTWHDPDSFRTHNKKVLL